MKKQYVAGLQGYENMNAMKKSQYLMNKLIDRLSIKITNEEEYRKYKKVIEDLKVDQFHDLLKNLFLNTKVSMVYVGNINEEEVKSHSKLVQEKHYKN